MKKLLALFFNSTRIKLQNEDYVKSRRILSASINELSTMTEFVLNEIEKLLVTTSKEDEKSEHHLAMLENRLDSLKYVRQLLFVSLSKVVLPYNVMFETLANIDLAIEIYAKSQDECLSVRLSLVDMEENSDEYKTTENIIKTQEAIVTEHAEAVFGYARSLAQQ